MDILKEQTMEPGELMLLNSDTICIPREQYERLIRCETEREALFHAYQVIPSCYLDYVMDAIFNPKFKYTSERANGAAPTTV